METMTVKQVSEVLQVSTETIKRAIREMMPEKMKTGVTTQLNEAEATAVKLHIEKNPHLHSTVQAVKTDLEKELIIQQAMQFQQEKIATLEIENAEMKPKAISYDTFLSSENLHSVNEAAKLVGTGQNKLFELLRKENVFYKKSNMNFPYQKFIDNGYFELKQYVIPTGESKAIIRVTAKGIVFIEKLIKRVNQ